MKPINTEFDQMRLTNNLKSYRKFYQPMNSNEKWWYSRLDGLNDEQEKLDLSGWLHSSRVNND